MATERKAAPDLCQAVPTSPPPEVDEQLLPSPLRIERSKEVLNS